MDYSISTLVFLHLCCIASFTIRFGLCTKIVCIQSEREVLLKLKHHLKDPTNRLSSWNATSNSNCCQWAQIVCNNVTARVQELHLNTSPPTFRNYELNQHEFDKEAYLRSRFGGEINPCLVDLKHLIYLDLSGNDFGMPIPTFLTRMTSLTHLNLSHAGFKRNIPHQIGNLSNLVYLDLRYAVNGPIPSQIQNLSNLVYLDLRSDSLFVENVDWLSSMSKLEYLNLGGANLSRSFHWLHTLQSLPSLKHLGLSFCTLPPINQSSFLNFSSLLTLDMSSSSAHSPVISFVPKWIFGLTKLVSLQLSGNNIQGLIPDGIQNLTFLQNLDLSYNSFSSSLPNWLYSLHHLKFLNLQGNNLNGSISNALGNLTSLIELHLSGNHLEGTISTSFGNLCNLKEIGLSDVKLNQQVSEILEILAPCISRGLTRLIVKNSHLLGNLTDQFGVFENIVTLDLSYNSIGGALPRSFGKLSSLTHLDLSTNQFSGNPFESLVSFSNMSYIDISDNFFQAVVNEDDLANLTSLKSFLAPGNDFTFNVGPNWQPNFQLTILDMSWWQLGPNFPSWLRSQNELEYLNMCNTGIVDSIPTWFWESFSQGYSFVNLSHNHIHGELGVTLKNPISISTVDLSTNHICGRLPYLSNNVYRLDLSSNSFSNSMDDFLCKNYGKTMQLEFLNLASNNLSGEISNCWMNWPFLMDVNLQSNHFVGNLPPSIGSLTELQFLQIRNNSLSGIFPTILKENSRLVFLDLGENHLSGTIPKWVGENLLNMKILRLRSNKFSGHIPNEICNMSLLQVLDLAQNNLSGNIPSCFNHLNAMTLMNKRTNPYISTDISNNSLLYPRYSIGSVLLWLKGRGDEYRSILGLVTSIDLSKNKLLGEIPREITNLNGLNFLNLSYNQLIGHIPPSIGNMGSLQSIDLSGNQLFGEIPSTISNLSFSKHARFVS
ncbi:hypothetical protein VNO78_32800 [Psophocarpus tetragonolobus]|uniref:Uncharacterized protein n=1 Tax=Psophocarpus tetragonolobus TaxID=3891 RepID=A0AAN9NWS7_PSOTE